MTKCEVVRGSCPWGLRGFSIKKNNLILSQTKAQLQFLNNTCVHYSQTIAWFLACEKRYVLLTNIKYYSAEINSNQQGNKDVADMVSLITTYCSAIYPLKVDGNEK